MVLRKRRLDLASVDDEQQQQQRAKRPKASAHNYSPQFWDSLSKIVLDRRALREFDRRTAQEDTRRALGVVKKPTRILRSDTKRLADCAKHGGPDLSSLRGYADLPRETASMNTASFPLGNPSRASDLRGSNSSKRTKTTGPYSPQFQQKLVEIGIYCISHQMVGGVDPPEPRNFDFLQERMECPHSSVSPLTCSTTDFKKFRYANHRVLSERQVMSKLVPIIAGPEAKDCYTAEDKQFTNMEEFDPTLTVPQPDKYYGAHLEDIDKQIREGLDNFIIPSKELELPALPNFFFEAKSRSGRSDVLQRQVTYSMATGARAMFQMQNYQKKTPEYDDNAYTIGSSYHPGEGTLSMYAMHPIAAGGRTEYYTTQLSMYAMLGDINSFRRGLSAFRNARDLAKEQRDHFIADANAIAQKSSIVPSSTELGGRTNLSSAIASFSSKSATSMDELAFEYQSPHKRAAQSLPSSRDLRSGVRRPTANAQVSGRVRKSKKKEKR